MSSMPFASHPGFSFPVLGASSPEQVIYLHIPHFYETVRTNAHARTSTMHVSAEAAHFDSLLFVMVPSRKGVGFGWIYVWFRAGLGFRSGLLGVRGPGV